VPYTLSTMSINSIEDVAEATTKPFWFQLYTMNDADYVSRLIQRAKDAKCSALVITLDLQILGQRHKDLKNGLSAPPKLTPKTIANLMTKWTWGLQMLGAKRREFGNIVGHVEGISDASSLGAWTSEQFDLSLDWGKIAKLKEMWGGKVILKGILDAEDAKMAVKVGADAIIVSNHGGRQLDGALSSIRMLPQILDAVGGEVEVILDSGIRSGQDVLKALAMGASGTMIGRAYIYGLGAMGQQGVTTALEVIHRELDTTMALCGERNVADLGRQNLLIPQGFEGDWQD
jgi:L-lactate dehydrogenase (cytochrome)